MVRETGRRLEQMEGRMGGRAVRLEGDQEQTLELLGFMVPRGYEQRRDRIQPRHTQPSPPGPLITPCVDI